MKLNLKAKLLLVLPAVMCICLDGAAEKIKELHGTYTYVVEEKSNKTFAEAWKEAIRQAQVDALKAEYGEHIYESVRLIDNDGKNSFSRVSQATADGEWIADTKEPVVEVSYDAETHHFIYNVEVWFKSRKIKKNSVNVEWKVLRDGITDEYESSRFNDKEKIYVSLQAASKGYCAVYLLDVDDNVNCLIPYKDNLDGYHEIQANVRNVFADADHKSFIIRTDYDIENDYICLIYSPNKFTKCVGERGDSRHLEKVSVAKFDKWLGEIRMMDPDMTVEWIPITIVNPSPTKERY